MDDEREMADDDSEQVTEQEVKAEHIGHGNHGIEEWLRNEQAMAEDDDIEGDDE